MSWNALPGIACIVSLFLPVAVIIYNRYYKNRSLAVLLIYYAITALYIMMSEKIIPVSAAVKLKYGMVVNYLDVPLMLTTLLFFCPNKQKQRIVHIMGISFIGYELIFSLIHGFTHASVVYIIGPGLLLILGYCFYLFARQVKFTIVHGKNIGRLLMLVAILFSYASFSLIYYFYYIEKTPYKADTVLLYYISSSISSIIMTVGLYLMRRRMKELQTLKITRKELAMFFSH